MDMTMKFEALLQCLEAIDRELLELREVSEGVDADALGLFDDMEELIGEGFLRCQLYMIERKGEHRSQNPFMCGPRHNSHFVAQIINTAGNYRKHRAEWPFDRARWGPQQLTAAAIFEDAGVVGTSYWPSNLLYCISLSNPPLFGSLVPRVLEWREALDEQRARSQA